ncbi:MAG: hypothetical protein ACE5I1_05000 [bacterium]
MTEEFLANLDYTNPEIAELAEHYKKLESEKAEIAAERERLAKQAEEKQKMIDRQQEEVGESRKLLSSLTQTVESLQAKQAVEPEEEIDDDFDDDDFNYTDPKVVAKLARKAVMSEVEKRFQNVATKDDVTKGISSLVNGLTATNRLVTDLGMTPEEASEVTTTAQELGIDVDSAISLLSKVRNGQAGSEKPDREKVTFEDEKEQKRAVAPPPESSSANAGAQDQISHDVDWLKRNLAKGPTGADLIFDWSRKYPHRYRAANDAMSQGV